MRLSVLAAALAPAAARSDAALRPQDLWHAWSFAPGVVLSLAASAALYVSGLVRLRRRGRGQATRDADTACFTAGWMALAVALLSPLHELGGALLSAHMVQHELLMLVAAPLLVLGRPLVPMLWALPPSARQGLGRLAWRRGVRASWAFVTRPSVAWTLHATAILLWHLPPFYQRSMVSETAHAAQHASFLVTALLFWWALLRGHGARGRAGAGVLYLFGTAVYTGGLGALLTVSTRLWYPLYLGRTAPWGLTPLEDQQLAGLIMWMPGALVYVAAAMTLAAMWLREADRRVLRWEALRSGAPLLLVLTLATLNGCGRGPGLSAQEAAQLTRGGDAHRGAEAIRRFGCGACHTISGIAGANAQVGPPLDGVGGRAYIAGVLTNTPENMVRWIVNPLNVDSLTAMPVLGVSEPEARDIAAYLYSRH